MADSCLLHIVSVILSFSKCVIKKPSKNVVDILRLKRKLKNIFKCDLDIKPKWLTHLRQKSLKNLEDMERQRRLKQLAFKRAFDLESNC